MASARYHEHMNTTGGTDHHFDPELDAYQVLGVIPAWVLERLWPGFVAQDYEVSINLVYVRRHMQKAPEHVQGVASRQGVGQRTDRVAPRKRPAAATQSPALMGV